MCNERDRLIAYIYNECDAGERDLVQRHLDTCDECRVEVAGLRSVREDLLSWDVPVHESVWRPFAPPTPIAAWWKQVPAWAMAAAAGIVVMSGAAGGAALHAFMPEPAVARQVDATSPAPTATTTQTLTSADLSAAEQRWLAQLRNEMGAVDARVRQASLQTSEPISQDHAALSQEVVVLREQNLALREAVKMFVNNLDGVSRAAEIKNADFQNRLNNLQSIVQQLVQVK